jgi:hypothetical protein
MTRKPAVYSASGCFSSMLEHMRSRSHAARQKGAAPYDHIDVSVA